MMLIILVAAFVGLTGIWGVMLLAMPTKVRLFLARHPFMFLLIHLPVMFAFTMIGGEGIIFGVGNLLAGLVAQGGLALWGVRKHGLTWLGRKGPDYERIHATPVKRVFGARKLNARQLRALELVIQMNQQERQVL